VDPPVLKPVLSHTHAPPPTAGAFLSSSQPSLTRTPLRPPPELFSPQASPLSHARPSAHRRSFSLLKPVLSHAPARRARLLIPFLSPHARHATAGSSSDFTPSSSAHGERGRPRGGIGRTTGVVLRARGGYRLPKHCDNNEVLKALCDERGGVGRPARPTAPPTARYARRSRLPSHVAVSGSGGVSCLPHRMRNSVVDTYTLLYIN
jgi:hypothetical protein